MQNKNDFGYHLDNLHKVDPKKQKNVSIFIDLLMVLFGIVYVIQDTPILLIIMIIVPSRQGIQQMFKGQLDFKRRRRKMVFVALLYFIPLILLYLLIERFFPGVGYFLI